MAKIDVGSIIDTAKIVKDVLNKAASSPSVSLEKKDVPVIASELEKKVSAVVTNATNQEPWYQSRVLIGTGISIVAQIAKYAGYEILPVDQEAIVTLITEAVSLIGVTYAVYGRLVAGWKKPLGQ